MGGAFFCQGVHFCTFCLLVLSGVAPRIISWARGLGPHTANVEKILASHPHSEQGCRSCLGLLRLGKRHFALVDLTEQLVDIVRVFHKDNIAGIPIGFRNMLISHFQVLCGGKNDGI